MARYTGPKTKISRRFGEPVFGPDKYLDRRNFAPGQHGPANKTRRRKLSDYGMQLREKQKAKYVYGMLEKQFRRFYETARARKGNTADLLLQLCESRLDNVVYRLGLAPTRPAARQLVTHRHVELDGRVVNVPSVIVPSFQVRTGDTIEVKEDARSTQRFKDIEETAGGRIVPEWLDIDREAMKGVVKEFPSREIIDVPVNETLIVELYSK